MSFAAPQKPENTLSILASVVGDTEAKTVLERSTSAEVKKLLAEKTNEAMDAGAFGLPWFVGEFAFSFLLSRAPMDRVPQQEDSADICCGCSDELERRERRVLGFRSYWADG